MSGAATLLRFTLRRERVRIPVYVALFVAMVGSNAIQSEQLYPTAHDRADYVATVNGNPGLIAMVGPPHDLTTVGGDVAWQLGGIGAAFAALMSMFFVGRHTRAEEQSGRSELVGAAPVGRRLPLACALVMTAAAQLLLGAAVTLTLAGLGQPLAGALALGASLTAAGLVFAGVAAVAMQLGATTASAYGMTGAALGGAYLLRAAGDVGDGRPEAVAHRGPDGTGIWVDRHVALGHRRLAIIDPAGGAQPMAAEHGPEAAVITHCGEVYNYRELRAELARRGHSFRTSSDTEVILHAYLEWGERAVDHLTGIYGLAIWDRRQEALYLIRDRFGVKPIYYHPTPDGVVFGSEPKAIIASGRVEPLVDLDGLREMFAFVKTPERSVYRDIREVRPGHVVRVSRDGVERRCYWRLEADEHTDDVETTVATVRRLLVEAVTRELIADVPLAVLLSGGLDSSALAAIASQVHNGGTRTFAVDFAGQTDGFQSLDGIRPSPDTPYARIAARHLETDHSEVVLTTGQVGDQGLRAAWLRAHEMPVAIADQYMWLYLLSAEMKRECSVVLSGSTADELFGGYAWSHDPDAVGADAFPWLALASYPLANQHSLLAPELRRALDVETYRADAYRTAAAEVPHVPGAAPVERRMRADNYFHLTRFQQLLLDRKDRMGMAHGVEFRVPFTDHALAQYVFNTPWSTKTFDGREKSLLRAAVAGLLPSTILQRRKCSSPSIQDHEYERVLRRQLEAVVADTTSPVAAIVDRSRVRAALAAPIGARSSQHDRLNMEMIVNLHVWLARDGVRLELDG